MQHVAGTNFSRIHQIGITTSVTQGCVLAPPEKFENGGFILKTHQMFSAHTTPEEFYNATTTGHF